MWASLTKLYQSSNENLKMVLREKLSNIQMIETKKVCSYLTRVTQVRDELGVVGEVITNGELVRTAMNGFSEKRNTFVKGVVSRENCPNWERLWYDFIQEETREEALCRRQSKGEENEENVALIAAKKKDKKSSHGEKKDMSKVRFYACDELGHYAGKFPNKKKKKKEIDLLASAKVVEFTEKFDKNFSLMACLAGIGCLECTCILAWFLDSGSSRHMTGMRYVFLIFHR
jgi:phosphatidate phosphatase PAH1